jgi:hypothetical protein
MTKLMSTLENINPDYYYLFVVKSHMSIPEYLYKLAAYLFMTGISYNDEPEFKVVYDAILYLEKFGSLENFIVS